MLLAKNSLVSWMRRKMIRHRLIQDDIRIARWRVIHPMLISVIDRRRLPIQNFTIRSEDARSPIQLTSPFSTPISLENLRNFTLILRSVSQKMKIFRAGFRGMLICLKRFGSDASVISKEDSQGVLSSRQHVTSGGEHVCAFGFALSQNDCPSSGTLQAQASSGTVVK